MILSIFSIIAAAWINTVSIARITRIMSSHDFFIPASLSSKPVLRFTVIHTRIFHACPAFQIRAVHFHQFLCHDRDHAVSYFCYLLAYRNPFPRIIMVHDIVFRKPLSQHQFPRLQHPQKKILYYMSVPSHCD